MALIDRTIHPRLKTELSAKELLAFYTPTQAKIKFAYRRVHGASAILNFLAILKLF